jgi:putative transposase
LRGDQAKRLKELELEDAQLKRVVADQALDNAMLQERSQGNF